MTEKMWWRRRAALIPHFLAAPAEPSGVLHCVMSEDGVLTTVTSKDNEKSGSKPAQSARRANKKRKRDSTGAPGICFAFLDGRCERGDACKFAHDASKRLKSTFNLEVKSVPLFDDAHAHDGRDHAEETKDDTAADGAAASGASSSLSYLLDQCDRGLERDASVLAWASQSWVRGLLHDTAFKSLINHKHLRKEFSESHAVYTQLRELVCLVLMSS